MCVRHFNRHPFSAAPSLATEENPSTTRRRTTIRYPLRVGFRLVVTTLNLSRSLAPGSGCVDFDVSLGITQNMPEEFHDLPSAADLCVQQPLYSPFEVHNSQTGQDQLYEFIASNFQIDTFCPWCAKPTVLVGGEFKVGVPSWEFDLRDRTFEKKFICSREHDHWFYFYFRLQAESLTKVGQSPSMADIEQGQIRNYRSVLDKDHYQELNRAIGLASHGVGIGSYVYLRRIFERLVEEAHAKASGEAGWDEDAYTKSRMDEKIALLKSHLPEFLVAQRSLYGILSKGVHSLDEETCLSHFPILRAGIELILDQKLALDRQAKKMAEATKQIGLIQEELKKD